MNAGVEIILERIKTHPDEFANKGGGRLTNGKWSRVLENYGGHLEQEEIDAINNAIDKVNQDYFTEEVMTILVDGVDKASLEEEINSIAHSITTKKIRLTSPDGSISRIVMHGSQSFKDLISQGFIDPKRMKTSA
jgi:hypothetical protein